MATTPPVRENKHLAISSLKPYERNARIHSDEQIQQIAESIKQFGFTKPIIVDDNRMILAGHGAVEAARLLERKQVPCVVITGLTKKQKTAYIIADNRLSDASTFDGELLALDIDDLIESGFDLQPLGLDELIFMGEQEGKTRDDKIPTDVPQRAERGDVFQIGPHRIMCGDSSSAKDMKRLTDGRAVDLVMTSPPYNVGVDYGGETDDRRPIDEYIEWLNGIVRVCIDAMAEGRALIWNIGSSPKLAAHRQLLMFESLGMTYVRQYIWRKPGIPIPCWWQTVKKPIARRASSNWRHENIYVLSKGPLEDGAAVVVDDRMAHDVVEANNTMANKGIEGGGFVTGATWASSGRRNVAHPAVYPVELVVPFINHFAAADEIVLDPFAGSATTIIAAHKLGRVGVGMEIDPHFVDVALNRIEQFIGEKATKQA